MEPDEDMSRREQTRWLSTEFLITIAAQTAGFLIMGTMAFSSVSARVTALESQQVTDARVARMEEKLNTLLDRQKDQEQVLRYVQEKVRQQ